MRKYSSKNIKAAINIYIYIYKYLLLESEYDMVKYFMSRLIYFMSQSLVKIKPESKTSSHITLTSVISGLFHIRYLHRNNFLLFFFYFLFFIFFIALFFFCNPWCKLAENSLGAPHNPQLIL